MSNHVHLIAVPHRPDALARAMQQAHGRYAAYLNARQASDGHVWQGRYYSCPLDEAHLWAALRYCELNPVRAGIVERPDEYRWSSAAAHCGDRWPAFLDRAAWESTWTHSTWVEYLSGECADTDAEIIRATTHTGRPLGSSDFVRNLESVLGRRLAPRKGGRRPTAENPAERQKTITFGR